MCRRRLARHSRSYGRRCSASRARVSCPVSACGSCNYTRTLTVTGVGRTFPFPSSVSRRLVWKCSRSTMVGTAGIRGNHRQQKKRVLLATILLLARVAHSEEGRNTRFAFGIFSLGLTIHSFSEPLYHTCTCIHCHIFPRPRRTNKNNP